MAGASARATALVVAAICGLGGLARLLTLNVQSYWYDEAATVALVRHSLPTMLHVLPVTERTPPLYYVCAWAWARLFGFGEVGLRSLSAALGTALILVAFFVGRRLGDRRTGIVLAALAAVNPLLFWYSQEARSYSLLVLLVVVAFLLWCRAYQEGSRHAVAGWALVSAAALATHYFALFILVPEVALLLRRRSLRPSVAGAVVALAASGAALAPLALRQQRIGVPTIGDSFALRVAELPKQLALGYGGPAETLATVAVAALSAYGLWLAATAAHRREVVRLVAAMGAGTLALPLLLAAGGLDYIDTRNLIGLWLALVLLVALGLGRPDVGLRGLLVTGALAVVLALDVLGVETDRVYQRDDWRGAIRALGRAEGRRAIVVTGDAPLPLRYYLPSAAPLSGQTEVSEVDLVGLAVRPRSGVLRLAPAVPRVPPQAGLRQVEARRDRMFTVVRYQAPKAVRVIGPELVHRGLSPASGLVYVQAPVGPLDRGP